jgi:SAM-dependent methyltransferase
MTEKNKLNVPEHWFSNSWEEKAQENPLFAVMTTPDLKDSDCESFTQEELERFFAKGVRVYNKHIKPCVDLMDLPKEKHHIIEYGCGIGRILKAVHEDGYRVSGIDISPTMLKHARNLVPGIDGLFLLDDEGRSSMECDLASLVFSFAVVKHIAKLSLYKQAIDEMCRVLRPGGVLALNVNCLDFTYQFGNMEKRDRTENHEEYSLHYKEGSDVHYTKHVQSTWSGVYIGYENLLTMLDENHIQVSKTYHHIASKLKGIWVIGAKSTN